MRARSGRGQEIGAVQASVEWLEALLWPERSPGEVLQGDDYLVFPRADRPHLLIPIGSPRAAARCIRQSTTATPPAQRAARSAISSTIRLGLAQKLFRARVRLPSADGSPDTSLPAFLRQIVGRTDAVMAITLGPIRANRKPVVEALTPDGQPLAFVKVGWNGVTRPLVRRESEVLARVHAKVPPLEHLRVPEVIHAGTWRDLELLAVTPAGDTPWRRVKPQLTPPLPATREVSELWGREVVALWRSSYWERLRARASAVAEKDVTPIARSLVPALESLGHTHGETSVTVGAWHGDWVPWNMRNTVGGLVVWDWERSDGPAPVGLDAVHFDFQTRLWVRKEDPRSALADTLRAAPGYLEGMGVAGGSAGLVVALCMLEMALRLEEGAAAGVQVPPRIHEEIPAILRRVVPEGNFVDPRGR